MQNDSHAANAPPVVTSFEITEPTAANAGIELLDLDAVQLEPQPLRARRLIVRLGAAVVMYHSSNRRLRTRTRVHPELLSYVTFGPNASGVANGIAVRPGLMLAAEPETEARFVIDSGWESITILVSPEEIRSHLGARQREFHMPHGIEALQADPDGVRGLFDWGKRLTTTAARQPAIFNDGQSQRSAAEVELFEMLLSVIRVAQYFAPTRGDRVRQAHSAIVRNAEQHALSRIDEHLSVSDLCRAAGASERALEYAFRDIIGVTPVAYLTRLRLHRVRKGLLAGTIGTTTVSAEALNCGFWHFGEFARAYRDCFGESPSETLRRPPDSAG